MTKEKQIIAIAELDGFEHKSDLVKSDDPFCVYRRHNETNGTYFCDLKYLTSRDAIIPVIEKLETNEGLIFMKLLHDKFRSVSITHFHTDFMILMAKPEQLAEALLRATNKWEE